MQRRLMEVVATLVLFLTTLAGPGAVTDISPPPMPVASAVASLDQAVGKVVRHLTVKAARHPAVQVRAHLGVNGTAR